MGRIVEKLSVTINGMDPAAPERFGVYDPQQIVLGIGRGCLGLITYTEQYKHLSPKRILVDINRIPENNIRVMIPEEVELLKHVNPARWSMVILSLESRINFKPEDYRGLFENRKDRLVKRRDWKKGIAMSNPDFYQNWSIIPSEK